MKLTMHIHHSFMYDIIEPWHRLSRTRKNIEEDSQEIASLKESLLWQDKIDS
jgi:hypothetical protein